MKQTLLLLLAVICLYAKAADPVPAITMTTTKAVGQSITFYLAAQSANTPVQVDFGDGNKVNKTIIAYVDQASSTITGTLIGSQTIKIYGSGIVFLYCGGIQLTALDVTSCNTLITLGCGSNKLTLLDVTPCPLLKYLSCDNNQLKALDVTQCTALTSLFCNNNQLTALDVTPCTALTTLSCGKNQLTTLDVTQCTALKYLSCNANQLKSLNVTPCTALTYLECGINQLTALDMTPCTALTTLNCSYNQLKSLVVTSCTKLTDLACRSNQLKVLDVTQCTALTDLSCVNNQLTVLDVTQCTALTDLSCEYNQLTALDVTKCTALTTLNCYSNQLNFASLPTKQSTWTVYNYAPQANLTIPATINTGSLVDLSSQFTIDGTTTTYTWKTASGYTLAVGTDYTISGGITTFVKVPAQKVYCEMTNGTYPNLSLSTTLTTIVVLNETPTNISLSATTINENVAGNSTVGTLSSSDPNAGNTFTYTLVAGTGDTDNASFNISGSNLRITNSPDFEAKNSYSVRVRTTDQGSLYFEKAFTITINNLDAPTVSTSTIATFRTTTATLGGNVTATGGATVTGRGVVYAQTNVNANPTIGGTGVTQDTNGNGLGLFSESVSGLTPNTGYSVRAYAINSEGVVYGSVLTFTTDALPAVTSVSVPSNGTYVAGQNLNFTVNFNKAITVVTAGGTPYLSITLNTGGAKNATYVSGSGTSALIFRYTVASGNADNDGISVGSAITANGGTLKDASGNNSTLTLISVGSTTGVKVDAIVPTVTSVSSTTANGAYKIGDVIAITVNFSESVGVTGTPTLALATGGTASYSMGSGSSTLTFNYTVGTGHVIADLDYTSISSLSLAGGTIKDVAGNNAILTLPSPGAANSLGANKAIVIDGVVPTVTITSTSAAITYTTPIPVTVTFSEAVTNFIYSDVTLTNGTIGSFSGNGTIYTFSVTPSGQGLVTVAIAAGVAQDVAGNLSTAATSLTRTYDNEAPVISGVVNSGTYTSAQSPTFNEGTATLTKDAGTAVAYASGTGINASGSYVLTVTDAAGNVATASFTITLSTGIADERKPSLSVYPNPCTDGFRVSGIEQPADVTITDLTGRVVFTTMVDVDGDVPVGHLKQGTYLVKVNERVLKLIKK
ncbi:putative secreted protein (Por secretion system target) [Breznakibacter xylanolyticus]|uniref:Putative secreted protein (Por secretion system target) n=1 Tax=Breznakibacter xylanolyticus TaxID=990 RepID=A0A2W7NME9_9BACT|nr:Ig-like domain-containing protein [Breznakibacter xylanolyticus]PZX17834.1 putative secreted protein (Por secretion system target) [Breznakibacter xylanolyticus]